MKNLIVSFVCAVGLASAGGAETTRFYRTTFAQDFREVYNADWSKLSTGPGAQIIDLDGAKALAAGYLEVISRWTQDMLSY